MPALRLVTAASFRVTVHGATELAEIEGSWTSSDFARLLERMEVDDTAGLGDDELREMCVLGLADHEPAAAAALLLEHRLGDELGKGQIQNISHEMLDEKPWEEHADMPLHERLFHVGSLLHQAFPRLTPVPDAVRVHVEVEAGDEEAERILASPLHESFVVRLLAHGMPDSAALNRLFEEAVAGGPFPEAESIAWIVQSERTSPGVLHLQVTGSGYWLDPLRGTRAYEASIQTDPPRRREG